MKIIASGDHHFDEGSRFEECIRIHTWMAELVAQEKPDLFLSGGDIYERASTPKEREAVAEWLIAVAETCPVVITKGNHDRPRDAALLRRLKSRHPIIVEEAAGVHRIGDAMVAAVAWPNRATLAAALGQPVGGEALDDAARDALRNVFRGLGMQLAEHDGPRIAVGHWMINGSMTSTGQPLIGSELNVGIEEFNLLHADLVVAGHIHMPQDFSAGQTPVIYCGSPRRTAYGEVEAKSVVVAEVENGRCEWRRVETPATPMLLLEATWIVGGLEHIGEWHRNEVAGAEVRLRYHVPADEREAARGMAEQYRAEMLKAGAIEVKLEEVVQATTRARAPEVAEARDLAAKLRAYWKAKDDVPPEDRAERLIERAHQLETEVES